MGTLKHLLAKCFGIHSSKYEMLILHLRGTGTSQWLTEDQVPWKVHAVQAGGDRDAICGVPPSSLGWPPQMQAFILLQTGGQYLLTALFP